MGSCFSKKKAAPTPVPESNLTAKEAPLTVTTPLGQAQEEETVVKEVLTIKHGNIVTPQLQEAHTKKKLEDDQFMGLQQHPLPPVLHLSPPNFPRKRSLSGDFSCRTEGYAISPSRNNNSGPRNSVRRWDDGEISRRRTQTDQLMSRNSSMRTHVSRSPITAGSPGKIGREVGEIRKKKESASPGKVRRELAESRKTKGSLGPKESLENPLVSLECFIFL